MALFLKAKEKRKCTKLFHWSGQDIMIYDIISGTKKNIAIDKPTPEYSDGIVFNN